MNTANSYPDDFLQSEIDLANAYIRRYATMYEWDRDGVIGKHEDSYWAYEKFNALVKNDPIKALSIIAYIARATHDEFVLSNLAAGPLEDLLRTHGPAVIDDIEYLARSNVEFKLLLEQVNPVSTDEVWSRVCACSEHDLDK